MLVFLSYFFNCCLRFSFCRLRSSLENIVDDNIQPMINFPDDDDPEELRMDLTENNGKSLNASHLSGGCDTLNFEQKRLKTQSKKKIVTDGFSSEEATSNLAESKRLQAGDIDYQQETMSAASRNLLELKGVKTEENSAMVHVSTLLTVYNFCTEEFP